MPDTPHHDLSATPRWYSPRGRAGRAEFWGWFFGLIPLSIAAFILLSIGWALAACYYISSGAGYMPMIAAGYTAPVVGLVTSGATTGASTTGLTSSALANT